MIDTHVHLYDKRYEENIDEIIESSKNAGVTKCIVVACGLEEFKKTTNLCKRYPDFLCYTFGFHPVDASKITQDDFDYISNEIKSHSIVAIGEIGLDYHWYPEEKEIQIYWLRKQLELAKELDLPIILHNRDSTEDLYEILKEYSPIKGVVHSFSENAQWASKFIELGLKIGISGPVTFKNGLNQQDTVTNIGLEHLLLETDGPYLTPEPYRGKTNKPEYVSYIASEIAFRKDISVSDVYDATTENAVELFSLDLNV